MAAGVLGRAKELGALAAAIEQASAGRGSVFHVVGEPGIGKTTLCAEAVDHARRADFDTAWGRCLEGAPAFWPWRALVPMWPDFDGGFDRFELFEDVLRELVTRARDSERGSLLVLDDIHWADESSLRLLEHVARSAGDHPLVLIVTSRRHEARTGEPLASVAAALARLGTVLDLRGLDAETVQQMAATVSGSAVGVSFAEAVVDHTNGNPFFVEQILALVDGSETDLAGLDVPAGVDAVVRERVSDLGDEAVEVLGAASVLGRSFDIGALRAVLAGADPSKAIDASVTAGLVAVEGARTDRLRFVHAIIRDALHGSLALDRRVVLHERALGFLRERGEVDASVLLAHAEAAAASLGTRPAIGYAVDAAASALEAQAFEEGLRIVQRAHALDPGERQRVELLEIEGVAAFHLDEHERSIRCFTEAADRSEQLGDVVAMSEALLAAGTGRLVGPSYAGLEPRIRRALERLDRDERGLRAHLVSRLADLVVDADERRKLLAEATDEARSSGDDRALGKVLGRVLLHGVTWMSMADRMAMVDELRAVCRRTGSADLHLDAESIAVRVSVEAGDLDGALRDATALAADRSARAGSFELRAAPMVEVLVAMARGQLEIAESTFDSLMGEFTRRGRGEAAPSVLGTQMMVLQLELGRGTDMVPLLRSLRTDPVFLAYAASVDALMAAALAHGGDGDGARDAIDATLGHDLEVVARDWVGNGVAACGLLVEAMWLVDHPRSLALLELLLDRVSDRNLVIGMLPASIVCWTTHALGLCALLDGRHEDARRLLLDAVDRHRSMGAVPLVGRSLLALAEAEVGRLDGEAALVAATEAAGILVEGRSSALRHRAETLLSALGGVLPDGPSGEPTPVTTTFVFTDIVSSTAQNAAAGDHAWSALLATHTSLVRALTVRHGGRVVKSLGDGYFATFPSAAAGTRFALEVSGATAGSGLEIRVGVHTGEAQFIDGDHIGHDVNLAARVSATAGAGEVLVSGVVASLLAGAQEFDVGAPHTVELKGIPEPQTVHLVRD